MIVAINKAAMICHTLFAQSNSTWNLCNLKKDQLIRSELDRLAWEDVDLSAGIIVVRDRKAKSSSVLSITPRARAELASGDSPLFFFPAPIDLDGASVARLPPDPPGRQHYRPVLRRPVRSLQCGSPLSRPRRARDRQQHQRRRRGDENRTGTLQVITAIG